MRMFTRCLQHTTYGGTHVSIPGSIWRGTDVYAAVDYIVRCGAFSTDREAASLFPTSVSFQQHTFEREKNACYPAANLEREKNTCYRYATAVVYCCCTGRRVSSSCIPCVLLLYSYSNRNFAYTRVPVCGSPTCCVPVDFLSTTTKGQHAVQYSSTPPLPSFCRLCQW